MAGEQQPKRNRQGLDEFATGFAKTVLAARWLFILLALVVTALLARHLTETEFDSNYRVFFSPENPELQTFENFQDTYTKNDNFLFVLEPDKGDAFSPEMLAALEDMTEEAWQIPYAIRVDSLANYQHTYAEEDDLIVENLYTDGDSLSGEAVARIRDIALSEPLLVNQLVTRDGKVAAINVTMQYPEVSAEEVPAAVDFAQALRDRIEQDYPGVDVHLTGISMLNISFAKVPLIDLTTLAPAMFLIIFLLTGIAMRSVSATLAVSAVVFLSILAAMGAAIFSGIRLTPLSASAPIIIMTLAVADSVHILMTMRTAMRKGLEKRAAIIEAMRVNFLAVTITSLTTIIGFLALNASDSPPFRDLGNITAMGIFFAWIFSLTVLPAMISLLPWKAAAIPEDQRHRSAMRDLADLVIAHSKKFMAVTGLLSLAAIIFIPTLQLEDQWREYFDKRIEFRQETDEMLDFFGFYPVEFSLPAAEPGGISEPEYLARLDEFAEFLRDEPGVTHVWSFSDVMKRLNKNLNADDPAFYRLPEERNLAAQYLLLYELSLPYGLDLNDRISIDKSSTRLTVMLSGRMTTRETKDLLRRADAWLAENAPDMQAPPTGAQVMFTYIAQRNVESMVLGTSLAVALIGIVMILTLRSLPLGLLSLIPNALPILTAFGVWALLIGQVGFAVASVASVSLGIVVDDTVHFLTKYARARSQLGLGTRDAIRYAFETVGVALIVNTIVLVIGFSVLFGSSFKILTELGLLTSLSILFALILDFFFLPPLLMLLAGKEESRSNPAPDEAVSFSANEVEKW